VTILERVALYRRVRRALDAAHNRRALARIQTIEDGIHASRTRLLTLLGRVPDDAFADEYRRLVVEPAQRSAALVRTLRLEDREAPR
jgi:hypothetical protein